MNPDAEIAVAVVAARAGAVTQTETRIADWMDAQADKQMAMGGQHAFAATMTKAYAQTIRAGLVGNEEGEQK